MVDIAPEPLDMVLYSCNDSFVCLRLLGVGVSRFCHPFNRISAAYGVFVICNGDGPLAYGNDNRRDTFSLWYLLVCYESDYGIRE